jgi:hypothetical protein
VASSLERVIIHAIEDSTFRAVLKLNGRGDGDSRSELDARPSDAIALALRTGSSIWMLEEVVADASIPVRRGGRCRGPTPTSAACSTRRAGRTGASDRPGPSAAAPEPDGGNDPDGDGGADNPG